MLAPNFLATLAVVRSPIWISYHPSKTLGCKPKKHHVSGSEEDLILENVEHIGWHSWDAQLTCPLRMGWGFDPLTVAVHRSVALPGHSFCTSESLLLKRKVNCGPATSTIFWRLYLILSDTSSPWISYRLLRQLLLRLYLSCEGDANMSICAVCGRILRTFWGKCWINLMCCTK